MPSQPVTKKWKVREGRLKHLVDNYNPSGKLDIWERSYIEYFWYKSIDIWYAIVIYPTVSKIVILWYHYFRGWAWREYETNDALSCEKVKAGSSTKLQVCARLSVWRVSETHTLQWSLNDLASQFHCPWNDWPWLMHHDWCTYYTLLHYTFYPLSSFSTLSPKIFKFNRNTTGDELLIADRQQTTDRRAISFDSAKVLEYLAGCSSCFIDGPCRVN